MTGPSQSIIARLTSSGQGAALWITARSELVSRAARTSAGSASSRRNWVGTACVCVTRCRSISRSASAESQPSISTTGWPSWIEIVAKLSTAVWYSGEPHRWTLPPDGARPNRPKNQAAITAASSGSMPVSGRRTPLGRPEVPEVYSIGAPCVRGDGRAAGPSSPSRAAGSKPGTPLPDAGPTANRCLSPARSAASAAALAKRSCATKAPAPLSPRM